MIKVLAIIFLVMLGLFVIIASIRQRRLVFSKGIFFLSIIAIAAIVISGLMAPKDSNATQQISKIEKKAPPVTEAPYVLQTSSRAYYIASYKDEKDYLVMTVYYYYDKNKWEKSDIPLMLDKKITPYKISQRQIGG